MSAADQLFQALVYIALPAALAYPAVFLWKARGWWASWIGRALLMKACGVAILLTQYALYQLGGPEYPGRDIVRNVGMGLVAAGVWIALIAMVHELSKPARTTS